MSEDFPGGSDIVKALQTQPERLGARFAVTLAPQKATQHGYQPHRFSERRRFGRRHGIFCDISQQGSPFRFFKVDRAVDIGRGRPRRRHSHVPLSGRYHIDTGFALHGGSDNLWNDIQFIYNCRRNAILLVCPVL